MKKIRLVLSVTIVTLSLLALVLYNKFWYNKKKGRRQIVEEK